MDIDDDAKQRLLDEAHDRAQHNAYADPTDNEAIVDMIDPANGFAPENLIVVSGLAYRLRHGLDYDGVTVDQIGVLLDKAKGDDAAARYASEALKVFTKQFVAVTKDAIRSQTAKRGWPD